MILLPLLLAAPAYAQITDGIIVETINSTEGVLSAIVPSQSPSPDVGESSSWFFSSSMGESSSIIDIISSWDPISSSTDSAGPTSITDSSTTVSDGGPTTSPTPSPEGTVSNGPTSSAPSASPSASAKPVAEDDESGDDSWAVGQDDYAIPEPLAADEIVLTLAYTANYNQSRCMSLADKYAQGATPALRRHFAEVDYKRRRRSLIGNRCLPVLFQIPTTVHFVVPNGKKREDWVLNSAWNKQLALTQAQLAELNVGLRVIDYWRWTGDAPNRFTDRPKTDFEWSKSWVAAVKKRVGSTAYNRLNIFIVDNAGDGLNGYANFPGLSINTDLPDAVIVGAYTILDNTGADPDRVATASSTERWGTTLVHEIGHWLGLLHPHQDNCDKKKPSDFIDTTPRYPGSAMADYAADCDGNKKGTKGVNEHNLMSYSLGRTRSKGVFNQEQIVRAFVGYFLRRRNLPRSSIAGVDKKGAVTNEYDERWLAACNPSLKRDVVADTKPIVIPRFLPALSKRQTSELLTDFCKRTDLVVENHEFSEWAETGLYGPNSPVAPNQPAVVALPQPDPGTGANDQGPTGFDIDALDKKVQDQYASSGAITSNSTTPNIPSDLADNSTSIAGNNGNNGNTAAGKSGAAGMAAWNLLVVTGVVLSLW